MDRRVIDLVRGRDISPATLQMAIGNLTTEECSGENRHVAYCD
jgi:hypothetical protein